VSTSWPRADVVALVAAGGAVGSLLRWGVSSAVPDVDGLPLGILAVNLVGAFSLGLLVAVVASARTRALLGTGLLGGFTTYSTFALQSRTLLTDAPTSAATYVLATVAGGYLLSVLGLATGRALRRRKT
jgi:CrcB protein